jgi:hypothetical protein
MNKDIMVHFSHAIITIVALLLESCVVPGGIPQTIAETHRRSTSHEAFTRSEVKLMGMHSGDTLTPDSLGMHFEGISNRLTGEIVHLARAEGWISSMSGGPWGAATGFGRAYGVEGNTIYGRHIFGYVYGNATLYPKYELRAKATIVPAIEYEEMKRQGRDTGIFSVEFGRDQRKYFFKDVKVDAIRPLPFRGPPEFAREELIFTEKQTEELLSVYTKASFEEAEAILKRMKPGSDWWEMVHQLDGLFLTQDYGRSYILHMKGYANYEADSRWQLPTANGIYEVWPFGYVENDKEVFRLSVIFRNGRLHQIMPYEPEASLTSRLRE